MLTEPLALHAWLYDLHTSDLLTHGGTPGEWGTLALLEETL